MDNFNRVSGIPGGNFSPPWRTIFTRAGHAECLEAPRRDRFDVALIRLSGRDLVTHPLPDHLALELGEREQHVEGEPFQRLRGNPNAPRADHVMGRAWGFPVSFVL